MLAPIVFFAVVVILIVLYSLCARKSPDNIGDGPSIISRMIYLSVFLFSSMFTKLATTVFKPLQCLIQPDGTFTMIMSPTQNCYEGDWLQNYPYVIALSIALLGVAPLCIIIEFWRNRGNTDSLEFDWKYGALTRPYRKKYYWWELVATVKKTVYVALVDVLADVTQYARLFYLICFLMAFMGLENTIRPYKTSELNGLNSLYLFSLV